MSLFKRKPKREPETHDYTFRFWGHDFTIHKVVNEGQVISMMGWGVGIHQGDYILLPNGEHHTRYKVETVEYFTDPYDMWKITAKFAPR